MAPRSSLPTSSKKRKSNSDNASDSTSATIKSLEEQLIAAVSSKSSLNALADLLDITSNEADAQTVFKAIYALYRVFVVIITNGLLLNVSGTDETRTVREWLQEKLRSYVELLTGLLKDEESMLKTSSLKILFSLQKHLSTSLSQAPGSSNVARPQFHITSFRQILQGLLLCPPSSRITIQAKRHKREREASEVDGGKLDPEVRELFIDQWLSECDDIRWFFLRESAGLLSTSSREQHPHAPDNLLSILERITTFPTEAAELTKWWVEELGARPPKPKSAAGKDDEDDEDETPDVEAGGEIEDDWRKYFDNQNTSDEKASSEAKGSGVRLYKLTIHQSLHSLPSHQAVFTRAWLTLLPLLSVGSSEAKRNLATRALNVMHRGVLPHLTRPILAMDWVGSCVDYGGTVGLLALNALFILMKEYNLDYPQFYTRLYAFLDRNVLHLKHRARFFRLTELFLSSTMLPVALLASFLKRLARLSLNAPPAAVVMIIPFTYNLLKKHPALMVMIHRVDDTFDAASDPFDDKEPNPTLTNAIDSSLWELYSQKSHYHAPASTLARIFEEPFTKPSYSLEDFLDHTYSTLYDTEVKRRIKKEPAIAMDVPSKAWFPPSSSEQLDADKISTLWAFS
ncbi:hypothetical protein NM688_g7095 [Phlebia brevispora]|uniref:Uncharacterized protein n=1 Tax=Phlebia brevispora TaxID=194682 RepID=A0ACC1S9D3_9APHY|nr:hypothetical protein NM688_g7095 [Phlebia brevispora]